MPPFMSNYFVGNSRVFSSEEGCGCESPATAVGHARHPHRSAHRLPTEGMGVDVHRVPNGSRGWCCHARCSCHVWSKRPPDYCWLYCKPADLVDILITCSFCLKEVGTVPRNITITSEIHSPTIHFPAGFVMCWERGTSGESVDHTVKTLILCWATSMSMLISV